MRASIQSEKTYMRGRRFALRAEWRQEMRGNERYTLQVGSMFAAVNQRTGGRYDNRIGEKAAQEKVEGEARRTPRPRRPPPARANRVRMSRRQHEAASNV